MVVRVGYTTCQRSGEGAKRKITTNSIRTAGYVQPEHLRDPRYEVLDGALE